MSTGTTPILGIALALAIGGLPIPVHAADADSPVLSGDWGGTRTRLEQDGIAFQLGWTNEAAHNASGGERHLTRSAGQFVLGTTLDLERLWNWRGASFQATVSKRYGENLGADAGIGASQLLQEIYGRGQTWWLTRFSLDQELWDGRLALRIGKSPVGADFGYDGCAFQNLTFCGAPPGNIEGRYWLNWPIAPWGLRARLATGDRTYLQLGVYQVNSRYTDDRWARRNGWKLDNPGGTEGALVPVEFGWMPRPRGLPGTYKLGAWINTGGGPDLYLNSERLPLAGAGGEPLQRNNSYGGYLSIVQQLAGEADGKGPQLFFNLTKADRATARFDGQLAVGLIYQGIFDRPRDSAGIAFGATESSSLYARHARAWNAAHPGSEPLVPAGGYEKVVEVFYAWSPLASIRVQPSLQYVADPGGAGERHNALVLGLRTSVAF
ncbi:carbohydrate porin [Stenotrophomonas sp. MMGLT7]|uniref:carbohydrate porin n=1 Tax=Stenotrophomonas sp. MMGLT7 TaxID=2901227 RepID=UPI001E5AD826|nr:carbohydrate porin [Stenotrophomonas sp. MMGLT7]MCD7097911.1 carbohydrate porin [Stenotrophomonas sp. MMGLT7]